MEVFIFLSRPDTSISRVDFSTDGSWRPDQMVTIRRDICRFPGSSTSGSKAYFLFKLHDPTSGESVVNSNWRSDSVHVYWTCVNFGASNPGFFDNIWGLALRVLDEVQVVITKLKRRMDNKNPENEDQRSNTHPARTPNVIKWWNYEKWSVH